MEKKEKKAVKLRVMIKRILLMMMLLDLAWFLFLPLGRTNADVIGWFNSPDFTTCALILVSIAAAYPLVSGKYRFAQPQPKKEKETDETQQ